MFVARIRVPESAFNAIDSYTPSSRLRSLIVCAAHFLVTKSKEGFPGDANAFSFNNETGHCRLGSVSFPVVELPETGLSVYGIRKLDIYS